MNSKHSGHSWGTESKPRVAWWQLAESVAMGWFQELFFTVDRKMLQNFIDLWHLTASTTEWQGRFLSSLHSGDSKAVYDHFHSDDRKMLTI